MRLRFNKLSEMIDKFILFGPTHIQTVIAILTISILVPSVLYFANNKLLVRKISYYLAFILIGHELVKPFYRVYFYDVDPLLVMPIHICHLAALFLGIFLISRIHFFFEIAYFWGLTGNVLAIITPDLILSYPDPQFITYYFGHGLLLMSIFFTCFCIHTKLRWISIIRVFVLTLLILPFIYLFNSFLIQFNSEVNYWYIMQTPQAETILSLYPQSPFHIPYLIFTALILFVMILIPYYFIKKLGKKRFTSYYNF